MMTYVLAWLFVNTWLTIIILKLCGETPHFWEDFAFVALTSVTTIFPFLVIRWVNAIRKKKKNRG